ncbi:hypothetical protein E4T43_04966 [Aureobasidium subglaciale]|nr:hypothetical protein E4T43_04966 [Aureobasidium subglaciale]
MTSIFPSLPLELRNKIYDYVLYDHDFITHGLPPIYKTELNLTQELYSYREFVISLSWFGCYTAFGEPALKRGSCELWLPSGLLDKCERFRKVAGRKGLVVQCWSIVWCSWDEEEERLLNWLLDAIAQTFGDKGVETNTIYVIAGHLDLYRTEEDF